MVKQKFDLGAPIFGKVKGYAPWPGSVAAITSKDRFGKKIFRTMCLDNTSLTNFYRQVQSVLLWDTQNGKPQIGRDVALQSRDESKVCDDEEHDKGGLPRGAFGDRREASKCCCAGCLGHSVSIYPKNRVVEPKIGKKY